MTARDLAATVRRADSAERRARDAEAQAELFRSRIAVLERQAADAQAELRDAQTDYTHACQRASDEMARAVRAEEALRQLEPLIVTLLDHHVSPEVEMEARRRIIELLAAAGADTLADTERFGPSEETP